MTAVVTAPIFTHKEYYTPAGIFKDKIVFKVLTLPFPRKLRRDKRFPLQFFEKKAVNRGFKSFSKRNFKISPRRLPSNET
jgi:hypothetical protein